MLQIQMEMVTSVSEGGLVKIDDLSKSAGEIDAFAGKTKGAGFRLGEIKRCVKQLRQAIKAFDALSDGFTPSTGLAVRQSDFQGAADGSHRALEIVRDGTSHSSELVHGSLDAVKHMIECASEPANLVGSACFWQPLS
jgi:hypothetical protein